MSEDKKVRIAAAVTVNIILLVAILAAVVIYQLVSISAMRDQSLRIKAEISRIERELDEDESTLEYWQSDSYLLDKAYELGFRNGN